MKKARSRGSREGYALLVLLATSAVLLAALALAIPRMAMQAQRVREERLIQRGEQYSRAIKLYYRQHRKYPARLDDLEDTDGVRYLRGRPSDPLGETGEWRLIHMGTDGRFEDSLLHDLAKDTRDSGLGGFPGGGVGLVVRDGSSQLPNSSEAYGPEDFGAQAGLPGQPFPTAQNRAQTVRESAAPDLVTRGRYNEGFGFDPNQLAPQAAEEQDGEPPDSGSVLPSEAPLDSNQREPQDPFNRFGQRGRERNPTASAIGSRSLSAQRQDTSSRAQGPGQPSSGPASRAGSTRSGQPGLAAGSGAREMINRLLTTPRAPGAPIGGAQGAAVTPQVFERGIAGVASQAEGSGVKVYNGRESYVEWEFVYDYRKDRDGSDGTADTRQTGDPARQAPGRNRTSSRTGPVR